MLLSFTIGDNIITLLDFYITYFMEHALEFNFTEKELSKLIKSVACKDCKYKCFKFWNKVGRNVIDYKVYCQIAHRQEDILIALNMTLDKINSEINIDN